MRGNNVRIILFFVCAALLVIASPSLHAQAGSPDLSMPNDEFNRYVGHYGEVFKVRRGLVVQPSMHGATEVINFHWESRIAFSDSSEPFNPKPEDFVAENFTRYALIQMIIMPWSDSSSKSLDELKRLKIEDLSLSGVGFEVFDDPHFPLVYGQWPQGSFEVWVSTPYRLSQLYTTSSSHLCILTSGQDTPPSTVISHGYLWIRSSLARWLVPQTKVDELLNPKPLTPTQVWAKGVPGRNSLKPAFWMIWAAACGILGLLVGFLKFLKRWDALRRMSLSLLVFSHVGALIGGLLGLVLWPVAWSSRQFLIPSALACLLMPLLALLVARIQGIRPRRRALIGVTAWALAASAYFGYFNLTSNWAADFSPHLPFDTAINTFVFYAIAGIIFGLLNSMRNDAAGARMSLVLAVLLLMSPETWAQSVVPIEKARPNPIEGDANFIARTRLTARGVTPESKKKDAELNLRKTQAIYKYQRVEIKGVWVKDDTNDTLRELFDKQIEPSHIGDTDNAVVLPMPSWIKSSLNHLKDLGSLHQDAYNQLSKAATRAVEELAGQEVNEIVAHSWGTEIVYNAILAGKILPPRRLIVAGMPDRDLAKWRALSKYTGTEVVVYANESDRVAGAARLGGKILDSSETSSEKIARERLEGTIGAPDFDSAWQVACRRPRNCNPHNRKAPPPNYDYVYKKPTHSRLEYYKAMLDDGVIPPETADARKLGEQQDALIADESNRLYVAALEEEVAKIPGHGDARSNGEASFLRGISRIAPISQQARAAFAVQEEAARSAWAKDPEYLAYKARSDEYRRKRDEADQLQYEASQAERNRQVAHWADMKRRWRYLLETTGLACSNPDELEQQARQGKVPGVSLSDLDLAWQMNRIETVGMKDRPVANECQKYILSAISGSNGLVSGSEVLAWSRRYRSEHPTLVGRFTTTIADFFTAMGDAFESGPGSPPERSSESAAGAPIERAQPETRERESRHSPDDWPSLRQLRGFKGF